ncbi:MAG TPA: hypothetical protein VI365_20805, partial [Trebonia sp.]
WPELVPLPSGPERDELRAELGGQVARLHTITGTGFGYPSRAVGPLRASWRAAFWGDPLAEFVSLALFGDIEQDTAFLHGYRVAGGAVTFDSATRQRLSLYQAYLYLIMWVEAVPRQCSPERRDWLIDRVFQPLTAAFDDGSPHQ